MIRINLAPRAQSKARASSGGGQGWLIGYAVAAVLWSVCLAVVYFIYTDELEEQQGKNTALTQEIAQVQARSAGLAQVQAALANSKQLETTVKELEAARQGPIRMLMELTKILTPGPKGGPTVDEAALEALRRENPLAGFNRNWDPRRLWITKFTEDSRECHITGLGKTNEDVAEFLRRLALSELFENVTLDKTESQRVEQGSSSAFIGFELHCKVRY